MMRVAVVGVGHFGRNHARIYAKMPGVELVAVADRDPERRDAIAQAYGCKALVDHTQVGDVDAVSVAVPTVKHAEVACWFLRQGIPVLVEKPLADTVDAAQKIVDTARRHKTYVGVGHVERFNPVVVAAVDLGIRPLFIECHRLNPFSFRATDVGVVLDLMIHDLDVILHLVGSTVERVDAVGVGILSRHEDIANARITFANGAVANVTASRVAVQTMRKIRVFSSDSYVSLDYGERQGVIYKKSNNLTLDVVKKISEDPRSLTDLRGKESVFGDLLHAETIAMPEHDPLEKELSDFIESARRGEAPTVPGEHGLDVVKIADAILEAIERSKAAALP
ncbi:MAG: Gfo/Idh/MocA family oxidoreductase [Planctomycetota bacterium]|nr:Gfo/Idh/MocA family oxidoreductase [Planctomycetota bacterium]